MAIGIRVVIEQKGEIVIIRLEGRVDATSTPVLEGKIKSHLESASRILVDFSDVDYLSSAGMRLLLSAAKKMHARQGRIAFCSMSEEVMEIIKMAGFDKVLALYPNEREALAALSR